MSSYSGVLRLGPVGELGAAAASDWLLHADDRLDCHSDLSAVLPAGFQLADRQVHRVELGDGRVELGDRLLRPCATHFYSTRLDWLIPRCDRCSMTCMCVCRVHERDDEPCAGRVDGPVRDALVGVGRDRRGLRAPLLLRRDARHHHRVLHLQVLRSQEVAAERTLLPRQSVRYASTSCSASISDRT